MTVEEAALSSEGAAGQAWGAWEGKKILRGLIQGPIPFHSLDHDAPGKRERSQGCLTTGSVLPPGPANSLSHLAAQPSFVTVVL